MRITLMRHAYAGPSIDGDPPEQDEEDDKRPLTAEGRKAATAVAGRLKDDGFVPTKIYASPAVRTMQTAKIAGSILGAPVVKEPMLYLGGPVTLFLRRLADEGEKRVMLVTHADVDQSLLKYLQADGSRIVDKFAMGEARVIDFDRDSLLWDERGRYLPSDSGLDDVYDHRGVIVSDGEVK